MRSLMNPRWLIVINTIPVLILASIFFGAFQIVGSLLEPRNIDYWIIFGAGLFVLWLLTLVYALLLIRHQQKIHLLYGLISLIFHIPFLYYFGYFYNDILPWTIPAWMLPENMILYMGSFLMPTLAHALLTLVIGLTPEREQPYRNWKNFALALGVPLAWYLFIEVIIPLWRPAFRGFGEHFMIISLLSSTVLFLLFLARGMYILSQQKGAFWNKYALVWKIPIALVFPLLGLALNNGLLIGDLYLSDGVFGDFSNYWFYALAIINGLVLCVPKPAMPFHRLLLFTARSITFSYTLYFFLVFVPFLPLSVIAILAMGLGFLLLTPLILMVLHSMDLSNDFQFLKQHYSKRLLTPILLTGIAAIPLVISYDYAKDRTALHDALEYIYQTDYQHTPAQKINTKALNRVLTTLRSHKSNARSNGISIGQTPFLSPLYNWLVLDNLTLSDSKINLMEDTFFGGSHSSTRRSNLWFPENDQVFISQVKTQSNYDAKEKTWRSWVDLDISNYSDQQKEFVATFDLPAGAWISDYYLWIEGEKVPGILSEKKTATWIYQKITSTRQDPGILYYLKGNKLAFRVFPFTSQEVRKTGFEIIHKEPIELEVDRQIITLPEGQNLIPSPKEALFTPNKKMVYIPKALKSELPEIQRKPYYHFIVDCSMGKDSMQALYIDQIQKRLAENPEVAKSAQITFANAYLHHFPISEGWDSRMEDIQFSGGFNLDRAIKNALLQNDGNDLLRYPKIVVFSPAIHSAILPNHFNDFTHRFPEVQYFQVVDGQQNQGTYSLKKDSRLALADSMITRKPKVVAWPNAETPQAIFPATPDAEVALLQPIPINSQSPIRAKNWEDALLLHGQCLSYHLFPGNKNEEWGPLVKNSFSAQVMMPVTSFISLENKAQRAALRKKQKQVLHSNQALDIDEDTNRMSEPGFFICLLIFLFWWVGHRRFLVKVRI